MKPFMDRFKWMRRKKKLTPALSSVEAAKTLALGNTPIGSGTARAIGAPGVRNGGGAGANTQRVTVPPTGQGPTTVTIAQPAPEALISISAPDQDSIVIEVNSQTLVEAWDTKEAMVDRPVGALGFAAGIAYIMTRGGWVNMGEALEKPLEMTDRRGMIAAQKARNKT